MTLRSTIRLLFLPLLPVLFSGLSGLSAHGQAQTAVRTAVAVRDGELTADVTDVAGAAVSGGVIRFDGSSAGKAFSLGAAKVDANGHAAVPLGPLPGQTEVRAVYLRTAAAGANGDPNGNAGISSVSAAVILAPDAAGVPDFAITANPASITAVQGSYATTQLTITPINDFAESVTLSCSNLPAQGVCTFAPVIGTTAPTGTETGPQAFTSVLEISTQAASSELTPPVVNRPGGFRSTPLEAARAAVIPGVLVLLGFAALRRRALPGFSSRGPRMLGVFLAIAATAGAVGLLGCSQRHAYLNHPPTPAEGTPLGTYTVTIAAAGNNGSAVTSHTITVTLAVTAPSS